MSSNFQGRKQGKSVSFRGQSNDSNFYESRPRNDSNSYDNRQRNSYRNQSNFDGSNQPGLDDVDSRIVTLLPDANMTISVQNDFKGSNKSRPRGSRGILKSQSFRDDTNLQNRSNEFSPRSQDYSNRSTDYDDGNLSSRRGFETYSFQGNRNRGGGSGGGRPRGFHNRSQHGQKYQPEMIDQDDRDKDRDYSNYYGNDSFRGRSKSANERPRRSRGGRMRWRGRSHRSSDDHNGGPTSGDGDKEDQKENSENDIESVVKDDSACAGESATVHDSSETNTTPSAEEDAKPSEVPETDAQVTAEEPERQLESPENCDPVTHADDSAKEATVEPESEIQQQEEKCESTEQS